jgi:hypothetical protein
MFSYYTPVPENVRLALCQKIPIYEGLTSIICVVIPYQYTCILGITNQVMVSQGQFQRCQKQDTGAEFKQTTKRQQKENYTTSIINES